MMIIENGGSIEDSICHFIVYFFQSFVEKTTTKGGAAAAVDEERVAELKQILSLLEFFLGHEFELRLYGSTSAQANPHPHGNNNNGSAESTMTTVDVTLVSLGFLLPLMTHELLAVSHRLTKRWRHVANTYGALTCTFT